MDLRPATKSSQKVPAHLWPWLVVLAVLLFAGFVRFRLLDMPLERDEGEYAYAGQLILQGIPPYELAYNMKLPGTYYAYALGMAVFGQTCAGVHLTLLAANALTIVAVFVLARKLFGVAAGLAACASYALMSVGQSVLGLAAHATQFVVLFAVPGLWLLWRALLTGERPAFVFSGLLFGVAFMMKQPGLCFGLFGVTVIMARAIRNRTFWERNSLLALSGFCAGLVSPFILFCAAALVAGDFARFWFWTFDYAGKYATANSLVWGMKYLGNYLQVQWPACAGCWGLAGLGLLAAVRSRQKRRETVFALGLLFFSFLGTTPGLYFRQHYFVLLLPALALLIGAAVQLPLSSAARRAGVWPALLLAGALGWNIWLQHRVFFQSTPFQACSLIYNGNPFRESLMAGEYIRDHSQPEARIAVIGSEPEIYFYAQRHSATGCLYTYPLMENQPYAATMLRGMEDEIEAARPEFLVLVIYKLSWLEHSDSDRSIFQWAGKFTDQFYAPAGIIGLRPNGEIVRLTGGDAAKFHEPLDQFMLIYQRRPDAP